MGAYLADPRSRPDREWVEVGGPGFHTAGDMNIGMPDPGTSIYSREALGGDWRPARARINAHEAAYHARVAELERGEGIAETAAERAA